MSKKSIFLYVLFVVVLFGFGFYLLKTNKAQLNLPSLKFPSTTPIPTKLIASQSGELATVQRVVDGDTIELSDGRKVRYIGINTPELASSIKSVQCFANEAKEINKKLVEGKTIAMKKDISETDKYKRLLRYVWIPSASSGQVIFVNEYLVREGYAHQATYPPDVTHAELFKKAAEEARLENKGLWNACK